MPKTDPKLLWKEFYQPPADQPVLVDVPAMNFCMIDGQGDPNTAPAYQQAMEALYAVSYAIKFAVKKAWPDQDYVVGPLEGLWWSAAEGAVDLEQRADWRWTALIVQPPVVTAELVQRAIEDVRAKRNPPALELMRFETLAEGLAAQIMHVGPYSAEAPTIERLHRFIAEQGRQPRGKHHEIYLGDPRRTAPERLRTVIRQPVG